MARLIAMGPYTHVEDTAGFDDIYRWAVLVDTSKNGATTERPYRGVKGIRLNVETEAVCQCLCIKVVRHR
jgi:hypothetical protein